MPEICMLARSLRRSMLLGLRRPPRHFIASASPTRCMASWTRTADGRSMTLEGVAKGIQAGQFNSVIVMAGAGISVSAGIPDFRTPGTGLYDNLQKFDLPYPEAIFDLSYFRTNPRAFNTLAKELYPGHYLPTPTHSFIKLLHDKKLLLRVFSQNIDGLELLTGLPPDKLVQAHGGFSSAHCIDCGAEADTEAVRKTIFNDGIPRCSVCNGLVKPDITFFGENLPERYHVLSQVDFPRCDLLFVMGTSLQVYPFAGLVEWVNKGVPRVLVNREEAGGFGASGIETDVFEQGDCDGAVYKLVKLIGWEEELDSIVYQTRKDFENRA